MRVITRDIQTDAPVANNLESIMTTLNKHEECMKKMQPYLDVVAQLTAITNSVIEAQNLLITLMCEQTGYPEALAKEIIHSLDKHS